MHPAIAAFPSAEFYDGRLKTKFDNKPGEKVGLYSNQEEVEAVKLVLGRVFSSPSLGGGVVVATIDSQGQWEDW